MPLYLCCLQFCQHSPTESITCANNPENKVSTWNHELQVQRDMFLTCWEKVYSASFEGACLLASTITIQQ